MNEETRGLFGQMIGLLSKLLKGGSLNAFDNQELPVTGAADKLTVPTGALYAKIRLVSDAGVNIGVRYLELGAGTLPEAAIGIPLYHGDIFDISGAENLNNFRAFETAGSSNILSIQYYK